MSNYYESIEKKFNARAEKLLDTTDADQFNKIASHIYEDHKFILSTLETSRQKRGISKIIAGLCSSLHQKMIQTDDETLVSLYRDHLIDALNFTIGQANKETPHTYMGSNEITMEERVKTLSERLLQQSGHMRLRARELQEMVEPPVLADVLYQLSIDLQFMSNALQREEIIKLPKGFEALGMKPTHESVKRQNKNPAPKELRHPIKIQKSRPSD